VALPSSGQLVWPFRVIVCDLRILAGRPGGAWPLGLVGVPWRAVAASWKAQDQMRSGSVSLFQSAWIMRIG